MHSGTKRTHQSDAPASRRSPQRVRGRRSARGSRQGRGRRLAAVLAVACLACLAASAFLRLHDGGTDPGEAGHLPAGDSGLPTQRAPETRPDEQDRADQAEAGAGPATGTGEFVTARASGEVVGEGATVRRYKVQVEVGTGVNPEEAAEEIAGILADPRGWTANGVDAFQLVADGDYDFEIKIATPDTVDRICGAAGLDTHGEVNCDVGDQVVVNLKRWNTGSPEFSGPLHEYRALIVNHEVGHRIGHGHEGCPGPGRPAPAMMQQIDGLDGCVANAWPYDEEGNYLSGPPLP